MLTTNVAFLAIQSVDESGSNRSAEQIASYISLCISFGTILLSLLIVRYNRAPDASQAVRAHLFTRYSFYLIEICRLPTSRVGHCTCCQFCMPYHMLSRCGRKILLLFTFHLHKLKNYDLA